MNVIIARTSQSLSSRYDIYEIFGHGDMTSDSRKTSKTKEHMDKWHRLTKDFPAFSSLRATYCKMLEKDFEGFRRLCLAGYRRPMRRANAVIRCVSRGQLESVRVLTAANHRLDSHQNIIALLLSPLFLSRKQPHSVPLAFSDHRRARSVYYMYTHISQSNIYLCAAFIAVIVGITSQLFLLIVDVGHPALHSSHFHFLAACLM